MKPINSRARTGLVAIGVLTVLIWQPGLHWAVALLTGVIGLFGMREYCRMGTEQGFHVPLVFAMTMIACIIAAGMTGPSVFPARALYVMILCLWGAFTIQMLYKGYEGAYRNTAALLAGVVYIGLPLSLALQILQVDRIFLMFGLALVWSSDSGAYFVGRKFGSHKFAPNLSPKKSVEGLVGGIAANVLLACLFKWFVAAAAFDFSWGETLLLALAIGLIAPVGDLAESVLKRDSGRKDSGHSMGGHGGVLDRIDSLLFCFPALYLFLRGTGRL